MNNQVITRFAPSPTGSLHLGGLRTALFSYAFAKHHNGKFLLRIEDTDRIRHQSGSDDEILNVLKDFNLHWDNIHVLYQSDNFYEYLIKAEELVSCGLAYKCCCSIDSIDECNCNNSSSSFTLKRPYCIKLKMPKSGTIECIDELRGKISFNCETLKDIVIIKQDGLPTYHFASVIDDISMGITHVFRGEEWISSLPYHVYLYEALKHVQPIFCHLPLILDPVNNCKLSKRNNNASVYDYLKMGIPKEAILNYLATLGYSTDHEVFTLNDFVFNFSIDNISTHSANFDIDKLKFYSKTYLNLISDNMLDDSLWYFTHKFSNTNVYKELDYYDASISHAISIFRTEIDTLSELSDKILNLINRNGITEFTLTNSESMVIYKFREFLSDKELIPTTDEIQDFITKNNLTNKEFHPLIRFILTGSKTGYQISDIITILGLEESMDRLFWV